MPRTRNAPPSPQATPRPTDKIAAKRPLQDITDRFAIAAVNRLPTPGKPRRKVKAPKLRAVKAQGIPSSLPPSSPPSTSSRLPIPDHHYHRSPSIAASDGENIDPQLENFEPAWSLGAGGGDPVVDALNTSDPFGFFAVEKLLKPLRAEDRQPRCQAAPPPQINTVFNLATSATPRKRHGKRRAVMSPSPDILSPGTDSMPSTPSPLKPISGNRKGKDAPQEVRGTDNEPAHETSEIVLATPTIAVRRRLAKRARKESSSDMGSSDPPAKKRRPVRRAAAATRTTRGARSERQNDETKGRETGDVVSRTGTTASRRRLQAKGKGKSTTSSAINDDQQEKLERERQDRLEYFRKLEDYQVTKENVYVV